MRGTYTVVMACKKPTKIRFGQLGTASLEAGYYVYTGSALGRGAVSLEGRLTRHKRRRKKIRWHIDRLTSHPAFRLVGAVYVSSGRKLECRINDSICAGLEVHSILPKLGATDCFCDGHLFRIASDSGAAEVMRKLERFYARFGQPRSWRV